MGLFDRIKKTLGQAAVVALQEPGRPTSLVNMGEPGEPPTPAALADAAAQVSSVASALFPDDADAMWAAERTWVSDGYAIASATPSVDVGYPRIAFAFRCERGEAFPVGSYVPTDSGWELLDSAGGLPPTLSEP